MEVFVKPRAQDKLGALDVSLNDIRRVVLQGAKRQVADALVISTLRDLRVTYRHDGDDVLVEDVERRVAPGIRGTSSPF